MKKAIIAVILIAAVVSVLTLSNKGITSADAIARVKVANPDLESYPSDNLPPKRIESQKTKEGWLLGFFMEGSGLPGILRAQCYAVTNAGEVRMTGEFTAGIKGGPQKLDLETCKEAKL
jgi:hypothetical protein